MNVLELVYRFRFLTKAGNINGAPSPPALSRLSLAGFSILVVKPPLLIAIYVINNDNFEFPSVRYVVSTRNGRGKYILPNCCSLIAYNLKEP